MPAPRRRARPRGRPLLGLAALLIAASCAAAQPDLAPRALEPDELDAATVQRAALRFELDTIVYEVLTETGVPGMVVALAWGGEVLAAAAYGTADVASGRPLTLEDPLQVASLTKTPVAIAILALAAEGRLDLDAPLEALLPPDLVPPPPSGDATPLTARHLLTHTGGFDERLLGALDLDGGPNAPLARFPLPPRVTPAGGSPRYGNAGHHALGLLLEAVTGTDVERALRALVFEPLDLTSARLLRPFEASYETATVPGHERLPTGELRPLASPTLHEPSAGQLRLSGSDAAALTAALTAEAPPGPLADGVRTALIAPAARAHPLAPGTTLGMWEGHLLGHEVVLQPGDLPGLRSLLLVLPGSGLGLFVHVNGPERESGAWSTADGLRDVRWLVAERIVERFVGDVRTPPDGAAPGALPDDARVEAGVYRPTRVAQRGPEALLLLGGLAQVRVALEADGAVVVRTPAATSPARRYLPTSAGVYVRDGGGDRLVASRGPRGEPLLHGELGLPVTLGRVPPLQRVEVLVGSVVAAVAAAAAAPLGWPLGAWRRWRARRPRGTEPGRALVALRWTARLQGVAILGWLGVVVALVDEAQRTRAYDAAAWGTPATLLWSLLAVASLALTIGGAQLALGPEDPASAAPRVRPRALLHVGFGLAGAALALQGVTWRLPPW
jgi:CubicO group peptidase (beta-lactamase class C family)